MSERLRDRPNDLNALIGITAKALRMSAVYIEKDFWVAEVLRAACVEQTITLPDGSLAPVTFTFKGGTSLSRVFRIVERFSEDVDLLAEFPAEASPNARHKILKSVDEAVRNHLHFGNERVSVVSSTTGVKRNTTYAYPTARHDSSLKEGVLLELGSRGGTQPSTTYQYRSLIADHAITVLGDAESAWEEFASFDVTVLAPERTLFEKLAAVHDAASRNDTAALMKHGRHFYDIYRLLENEQVVGILETISSVDKQQLIRDIEEHSSTAGFSWTKRPVGGYGSSPACDPHHASRAAIETGYKAAQPLIYGERVSLDEVLASMERLRDLL
ncbi:nucleotidyl transferase AbiEii/AbiGii toxin family protein [Rathayibacter toxicus]|uniref:nucleotidyl transferase AbiEii/AbiGii toxin family protein n=2 Tax=Rathayibacter toxicus TaxID=145458 RepID=UPI001C044118|nr:nucleotidyl transferase AbiEii/AbiGii toxin family protein [Rathayibacter toxicus]QWL40993.1 nucleotidyl transferase AbiEii/AbiGii toxin family protein [Rathayibacter toxicus]QWL45186.1 nucleotidyl transferase AbiEii/AbiGii toxin family protein [Rathayibacter toxicus]